MAETLHLTPTELRSSIALSSVFALRMLGLFLILPVFALYARSLEGGNDTFLVGLTLGIYGLTQGILQIPYGIASDRYGRKPIIILGLVVFALGSFICATADTVIVTMIGRAIQGTGAISAAVTAMIADSVRIQVITKAMAFVGSSISLTFAFSLVASPVLSDFIGVPGLFHLTTILCIAAIGVMLWVVPDVKCDNQSSQDKTQTVPWYRVTFGIHLLRLNLGIFFLHIILMAFFVVVPLVLTDYGLDGSQHWMVYFPCVALSFIFFLPLLNLAARTNKTKLLFLSSIAVLVLLFATIYLFNTTLISFSLLILVFFTVFNILEALLPSLVAKTAPQNSKGLALGVYNTTQSIGLFVGGALGGWIYQNCVVTTVYLACGGIALVWLIFCLGMKMPESS